MKLIEDIIGNVKIQQIVGNKNVLIKNIQIDSREVKKGSLYIAIKGIQTDGHLYIGKAIQNGATAVVCEILPKEIDLKVTYIVVEKTAIVAGVFLNHFYDDVSQRLKIVGVTGTNGKTSVATLLFELFKKMGYKCGLLSTVCNFIHHRQIPSTHTTPDVVNLYYLLNQMYKAKCEYVFMECSSHAIHQYRIGGLDFKVAVFTNITHDHLDYHHNFKNYILAKKMLFDGLNKNSFAIVNGDDKNGRVMLQNTKAKKKIYTLKGTGDYQGVILHNSIEGIAMKMNQYDNIHFRLVGEFNAYNLLAVYATAHVLGIKPSIFLPILSDLKSPEGRFNVFVSDKDKVFGIVDYAHTPDALKNVLQTIYKAKKRSQKVIVVVGCGGNRDKLKRPLMAKIAVDKSHSVILTSDNPRNENPLDIIKDMRTGIDKLAMKKVLVIVDREEAIKKATELAGVNDIILVAGKGHENYQDINGVKTHFNDKEILLKYFLMR